MSNSVIDCFRGDYFFLSNFYEIPVSYNGITYQNSEAAFQAQKTFDENIRREFSTLSPKAAKKKVKSMIVRSDWQQVKVGIMKEIVTNKFVQNPDLKEKLLATGDRKLVEGNTWNDKCWGVDIRTGRGKNQLGHILEEVRQEFRS